MVDLLITFVHSQSDRWGDIRYLKQRKSAQSSPGFVLEPGKATTLLRKITDLFILGCMG